MSLWDSVLSNTAAYDRSAPRIVSAVHDLGAINWVAGMTDPGEMIGCGMYQELRRLNGETDASYAVRLPALLAALPAHHREKIERAGRGAAQKRAGLDTTGGRVAVMVAGKPAWHGLGVNVADAVSSADAIRLAGLNWNVSKRAMSYRKNDGSYGTAGGTFAIVRDDSEAHLGTVGGRYQMIQNRDGFEFLDSVIGEFGAKFHTAGSIYGGAEVWMQCELPDHSFEVVRGDEVQTFALFTNPHDGSGRAWCFPTTNRVVCANTFRTASKDRAAGLGIRHSGNVAAKVVEARAALGLAVRAVDTFHDAADVMARTPCNAPEFFDRLLDEVLDITAADVKAGPDALARAVAKSAAHFEQEQKRAAREIENRRNVLEDILTRYDSERCGVGGIRGTQWAAFNAVTEHADHRRPGRLIGTPEAQASRRFESVIRGDADELKQTAFEMLTAPARRA
jgi:phage/plasmid-like protein (TIGR03299 family)